MNNIQDIETLKEAVKSMEAGLPYQKDEATKKEIIKEIDFLKNKLIQQYKDTTYTKAMTFKEYEEWIRTLGEQKKHQTGIDFIDNIFGGEGIQEESFINIVGESGSGKSTLGLQILLNVANKEPAYFISLEMGRFKTYNKIKSMIDDNSKQYDNLIVDIWEDDFSKTIRDIELYAHNGCKFFLIDSKMKLRVSGNEPTHEKISRMSNELSSLTQKHGIIIMLINQISEEDLKNKRVSLKGSGDQKFDTDLLISIEVDKKDDKKRIFNLVKNRQNDVKTKIEYDLNFKEIPKFDIEVETTDYKMEVPYV
jgi:predicted ATP-dependent serine protease